MSEYRWQRHRDQQTQVPTNGCAFISIQQLPWFSLLDLVWQIRRQKICNKCSQARLSLLDSFTYGAEQRPSPAISILLQPISCYSCRFWHTTQSSAANWISLPLHPFYSIKVLLDPLNGLPNPSSCSFELDYRYHPFGLFHICNSCCFHYAHNFSFHHSL